jgi:DNA-binding response OmpR family regulator
MIDTPATPTPPDDAGRPQPAPVLLVEDDASLRALLTHFLDSEGFTVLEAEDGGEATRVLDRARSGGERPGLVLLDLMLPGESGLQVLERVLAHGDDVPVIGMSVHDAMLVAAMELGATAVLIKPFELDQVLPIVARYCEAAPARAP